MTTKSTIIQKFLLGNTSKMNYGGDKRVGCVEFPSNGIDHHRYITFPGDDGFILYLLRRIEKMENDINELYRNKHAQNKGKKKV